MLKLEYLDEKKRIKKSTVKKIYDELKQMIIDGALFPGFKITEQQFCDKYKCSRTPIREVFRQLENTGLIRMEKNKGATIVGFTPSAYADLIEEREALENLAIKLSIIRIQDEERKLLDQTLDFLKFYYIQKDYAKLAKIIKGFYQIIYYSTYNPRIENQLLLFYDCANRNDSLNKFYEINIDEIYPYYNTIYDAYTDQNIERAQNALAKINDLFKSFNRL